MRTQYPPQLSVVVVENYSISEASDVVVWTCLALSYSTLILQVALFILPSL